jgi:hypothetical protein
MPLRDLDIGHSINGRLCSRWWPSAIILGQLLDKIIQSRSNKVVRNVCPPHANAPPSIDEYIKGIVLGEMPRKLATEKQPRPRAKLHLQIRKYVGPPPDINLPIHPHHTLSHHGGDGLHDPEPWVAVVIRIHPDEMAHERIHVVHLGHKAGVTVRTRHVPALRPHPLPALVAPV